MAKHIHGDTDCATQLYGTTPELICHCDERRHGDIEQTHRCDQGEIGYEVRLLQQYEYDRKSCELKSPAWWRIGVGIMEPV